jgi:DNA end-binding protein Ku
VIDLDVFVNFFEVDPHYVDKTYLRIPNGSEASYAPMRRSLQDTGKAAIGRVTLRSSGPEIVSYPYWVFLSLGRKI